MKSLNCYDSRPCFAKNCSTGKCRILVQHEGLYPYADGVCPFCKPRKEFTNGKYYPYNIVYAK